jgi:hypothetical protein
LEKNLVELNDDFLLEFIFLLIHIRWNRKGRLVTIKINSKVSLFNLAKMSKLKIIPCIN